MEITKKTIYPELIKKIIISCLEYKLEVISLYELKAVLLNTSREVSEPSEKEISRELMYFEGDLDEVQVMNEDANTQKAEALKVISNIEEKCYSWIDI